MKAISVRAFGGVEALVYENVPQPVPGAGEVLVRLEAAGVGTWDPDLIDGSFEDVKTPFPRVLGSDGAGTVVAAGSASGCDSSCGTARPQETRTF